MPRPMVLLAYGAAVLDEHARLARLEASTSLFAAIGTADDDLVPSI